MAEDGVDQQEVEATGIEVCLGCSSRFGILASDSWVRQMYDRECRVGLDQRKSGPGDE